MERRRERGFRNRTQDWEISQEEFEEIINPWLETLSPNTKQSYSSTIYKFIEGIGGIVNLSIVIPSDIESYLGGMKSKFKGNDSLSRSSKIKHLAGIRSMFRVLESNQMIFKNPTFTIKIPLRDVNHHQDPGKEIVLEGLKKIHSIKNPALRSRDKAIFILMLNNGLRRSEIAHLKVSDFQGDRLLIHSKGGKIEFIMLNDCTIKALKSWLKHRVENGDSLFFSFRGSKQSKAQILPKNIWDLSKKYFGCNPHALRVHSISQVWEKSGSNVHISQIHARHSSPAITEKIYIQGDKKKEAFAFQPRYG